MAARARIVAGALAVLLLAGGAAWLALRPPAAAPAGPGGSAGPTAGVAANAATARFVGSEACAACHAAEHAAWRGSQHARAMQHATEATVLGDFSGVRHTHDGVTSRFFRRDGKFVVRTDGPDGRLADFEVRYTFGVEPLQQYLVELPGGRLQALSVGWDTRPREQGGQRWFRQYPGERIDHRDELHWTRRSQNWNFMCADCHSTDVRKGYDAAADRFDTRWAEISVGCESCHGPGSSHIEWSRGGGRAGAADASKGLAVLLDERRGVTWRIDATTGNAVREPARTSNRELETCAGCHSRRSQFAEGWRAGHAFMDHYLPSILEEGLYHADGQQRDEVFTWGSFLQSRMHAAGVSCSDCHDPHTQQLRAPGNAVCAQCHSAAKYEAPAHHFHPAGSAGAQCANCHMPAETYMVVDPRRDHSFRVPRPDLTVSIGTPNACGTCHADEGAEWAAQAIAARHGTGRRSTPHYGEAIHAGRAAAPGAARGLAAVAVDVSQPAIVRATAVDLVARYPGAISLETTRAALRDREALVRHTALRALESLPPDGLVALLGPLLADPSRAVRIEAARVLAPVASRLDPERAAAFGPALAEFEAMQRESLDRPESHLNLGNLALGRGDLAGAEAAYRRALAIDPGFVPGYVNLADLERQRGQDAAGEKLLREGLRAAPAAPALHEALAMSLVRQGRKRDALAEFAAAARVAPESARHAWLHALALVDAGRRQEAIRVLERAAARGGDRDVLLALATFRSEAGDEAGASAALRALQAVNPDDPALVPVRERLR